MKTALIETDGNVVPLHTKVPLTKILSTANVCELLTEAECKQIGSDCRDGYSRDLESRRDWETRYAEAMKLALQVTEEKTFPWPNCANVKFPLVTVAALQYSAKAYPAIVNGRTVYEGQVMGDDPDGKLSEAAERIGNHMTWQCLHQDPTWEEETDKLFIVQSVCGCAFRKTWFDPVARRLRSRLVLPSDLVVNYYTRSLADSQRYTHRFYLSRNDIVQRQRLGLYCKDEIILQGDADQDDDEIEAAENKRQGVEPPEQEKITPHFIGEQYCWFDLDGDGFDEPYIVTFDINTGQVWRIAARFLPSGVKKKDGDIIDIVPVDVFTKYPFIPSPDNGFYDLGLGALVGPINNQVNGALNQLFDAGTMSTLGGGFVGRGFKGKGGPFSMRPFMWMPTDAPGDDLRKNVLPLPVKEPSPVLFQLLGFLTQYAERIVSATEIQMGESPGQNMKAGTAEILNQNGARVFNAIYKRDWRSIRDEGLVRANLNKFFLEDDVAFNDLSSGRGVTVKPADYRIPNVAIAPAADPHIVSEADRKQTASMILANAFKLPGHNKYKATMRFYKAMNVSNIQEFLEEPQQQDPQTGQMVPAKDWPMPPDVKMLEVGVKQDAQKLKEQQAKIDAQVKVQKSQDERALVMGEIIALYAKAKLLNAQASSTERDSELKMIELAILAKQNQVDGMAKMIELAMTSVTNEAGSETEEAPGMPSPGPAITDSMGGAMGGGGGGGGNGNSAALAQLKQLAATIDQAMGPKVVSLPDGRSISLKPGPNGSRTATDANGRVTTIEPLSGDAPPTPTGDPMVDEIARLSHIIKRATGPKMVFMPDGRRIHVEPGPDGAKKATDESGRVTIVKPTGQQGQPQ